jgi:hypothetical protein
MRQYRPSLPGDIVGKQNPQDQEKVTLRPLLISNRRRQEAKPEQRRDTARRNHHLPGTRPRAGRLLVVVVPAKQLAEAGPQSGSV